MINGTYKEDPITGQSTYIPHDQQTLGNIKALASSAIGLDTNRGDSIEVINMQFAQEENNDLEPAIYEDIDNGYDLEMILNKSIPALIIIFITLFIIRPIVLTILSNINKSPDGENKTEVAQKSEEIIESTYTKLNNIAATNQESIISIIRKWMEEDTR